MKVRCYDSSSESFKNYGARGITVCERWRESFEAFLSDMGARPKGSAGLKALYSIERKDNNGNYEPDNCIWATTRAQAVNRRNNHRVTFNGVTKTAVEWARDLGIGGAQLVARLDAGWPVELALTARRGQFNRWNSPATHPRVIKSRRKQ